MTVKVVPLAAQQGLKFDLILPDGYVVTILMDEYEVRQYRGNVADVIEAKINLETYLVTVKLQNLN